MRAVLLTFVAGSAAVALFPALPNLHWLWLLVPVALACLPVRRVRWLGAAGLGLAWALLQCSADITQRLPLSLEGKPLVITGVVTGLPRLRHDMVQFQFNLDGCEQCWAATTIKLSWFHCARRLRPGQRWRFTVRLKRPHGSMNPGLFDYQGWLLSKGISAGGYVIPGHAKQLTDSGIRRLPDQLRYWLRAQELSVLPDSHISRLLVALTVGDGNQVSAADWQTLSATGTNHLLVISGLHIGLVAALSYRVVLPVLEWLVLSPARWASLVSLVIAACYGAIAGMGLPVQRALVMATVALSGKLLNRKVSTADMYCHALFLVTLLDPLAVLSTGFWLSFGAVFALLYAFAGRVDGESSGRLKRWASATFRTQSAVLIGMTPLLMYLVFRVSLVAFPVNLIAIPWVGMLVIPLLLLAMPAFAVAPGIATSIMKLAAVSLGLLWHFLAFAASYRWVFHASDMTLAVLLLGLCGVVVMLAPGALVPRWLGVLLLLPAFAAPRQLAPGEVVARVLDVGKGLAVIVQSRDFRVVYEAAGRRGRRFATERRIVTPMLWRFGDARYLGALIFDKGSAAGDDGLLHHFLVGEVFPGRSTSGCGAARVLSAGRTEFRVIPLTPPRSGGHASCALMVKSGKFAVVLSGDAAAPGQLRLMNLNLPAATVLVVHGSGGSFASPAFLNHVRPRAVVFSTGYGKHASHPSQAVVNRYVNRGITTYTTVRDGEILIDYKQGSGLDISTARSQRQRFWYD